MSKYLLRIKNATTKGLYIKLNNKISIVLHINETMIIFYYIIDSYNQT